ncbi:MAG: hypothetical protein PVJ57_17060 [Phycisphaerae bacterium]|jgi:hypothetical protein
MLEIAPHTNRTVNPALSGVVPNQNPKAQAPAASPEQSDRVELSEAARTYEADSAADVRIRDLRAQIAADEYITDDMLDVVVDRLHEELFGKA